MAKVTGNGSVVQLEKDKPRGKCRKWQLRVSCGRSPRTGKYVNKTRAFQGTYSQACAELRKFIDEIEGNKAKPPKIVRSERRALTPQQAREFVSKLDPGNAHHCAYLLAVSLGLRRGEVCGLSWSDVDLENRTVHVRHNLDVYGNLKEPKTKAGIRMLPMSDRVHEALSIRKRVQAELLDMWRRASLDDDPCPDGQTPDSPVISNRDGTRISPNSLARWWDVERGELGMDGWTLHELRHTYLTTLAVNGVHPKVMQELAGHARMATTLEIYTHVNMDAKREAMRAVSDVF